MRVILRLMTLCLFLGLSACVRQWSRSSRDPIEAPQSNPRTAEAPLAPISAATGTATPLPSTPLQQKTEAPQDLQIVFHDDQGLWLADLPEGTVINLLEGRRFVGPSKLGRLISSDGTHLAALSLADDRFHDLTLHVFELPSGRPILNQLLTSPDLEPGTDPVQGDPRVEIVRVLMEPENLAWSPDGETLAFIGAHQGTSADLYVFRVAMAEIQRLTDGPSQALHPTWSPNGRYIVHAGVSTLGTGAGYGMEGVWAALEDGSDVQSLYSPAQSSGEFWVGWYGDDTILIYTFGAVCGYGNLRTRNIITGAERTLWSGTFQHVAYDEMSGFVLLSVEEADPVCNPAKTSGLILTHPEAQDSVQVWGDWVFELDWSVEADAFLAATGAQSLLITASGDVMPLTGPPAGVPQFSADGRNYAWVGPAFNADKGVWVNEAGKLTKIFDDLATTAMWAPGWTTLYFFGRDGLYEWQSGAEPVQILPDYRANDAVLISHE